MYNNIIEHKALFHISQDLPNMYNRNLIPDIFFIAWNYAWNIEIKRNAFLMDKYTHIEC